MRRICSLIWNLSEWTGIGLGRFAPWVFGGLVGARPRRDVVADAQRLACEEHKPKAVSA